MVPGERISKMALRQIDYAGQRGDSFYDKLKVAAEDGTLTARDARIAAKRIDTIEKLQAAGDDRRRRSSSRASQPPATRTRSSRTTTSAGSTSSTTSRS